MAFDLTLLMLLIVTPNQGLTRTAVCVSRNVCNRKFGLGYKWCPIKCIDIKPDESAFLCVGAWDECVLVDAPVVW